jgi:hypothetical protein
MAATRRYDEELRSIGQALEARDISVFDLKQTDDNYAIEGTPDQAGSFSSKLGGWLRQLSNGSRTASVALSVPEVERLSQAGRAKRTESEGLPNFRSVSSILRTIGAYLDSRGAKLVELQKRRISITLLYRDPTGQEQGEDRTVSSFHPLFVELCGKRGQGVQAQVQSKS